MFMMHHWMQRCRMALAHRLKTGSSQTGQLPGRTNFGLRVIEWIED